MCPFDRFQTLPQQLPRTRNNMQHGCKRTQHVISNNVASLARNFITFIDTTYENYNLIKIRRKSNEKILIVSA